MCLDRIVDGIETDNSAPARQKLEFSTKQLNEDNNLSKLSPGEAEETKQNISKLNFEMSYLSQQVTQLSKDLQDMMQVLKPLLTSHNIALDNLQQARKPDEHNARQSKALLSKLSLPADTDCLPDKVAELLSPFSIRLTREPQRPETCSFELMTSAEDSSSDSIQFIDDEGTNV
ncbi:hypothetical protein scyTo_0010664 [Scyliorhinus torazame]|uniref:Uncharacterized protein n=1 Tax=Scyliorhinus torazame TaxID=75743 RepID=A0A401P9S2_SCYTO|nr:hypothetical protein [Scyliorhinus torazame]